MAGYSAGFGGGISGMFSASDFFTVTLQHLVLIYATALIGPAIATYSLHRLLSSKANALANDNKARFRKSPKSVKLVILAIAVLMTVTLITSFIFEVLLDVERGFYQLFIIPFFWAVQIWPTFGKMVGLTRTTGIIAWHVLVFTVTVFSLGLTDGHSDRRLEYKALAPKHMFCGDVVILTPVGDRFVAVDSGGVRHIVNDGCKKLFTFNKTSLLHDKSDFIRLLIRWWGEKLKHVTSPKERTPETAPPPRPASR
ncbi:hypothetical protein ACBY01_14565 [Sphingomonas sp. ac-8]|uniref:hypothetical protein n=1 Tax=Sphingomonas sp. ac-8 TaxID=3242977 RepID=UPI003A81293D